MAKQPFDHIGGHPLIDLVNTEIMRAGQRVNLLQTNQDVIDWCVDVGLIEADAVQFAWEGDDNLLPDVLAFRQQMRAMLDAIVADDPVPPEMLPLINEYLKAWQGQPALRESNGVYSQFMAHQLTHPAQLLALLAEEAADFLTNTDYRYVKQCNNGSCIRFFLDTSKNHSRRWCSMETCGNRVKARKHYARHKND